MSKKRTTLWRLWCYSLGAKSGKNDREANIVSAIRTVIFTTYLITNAFIIAGVIRHWNKPQPIEIFIDNTPHEVSSCLSQTKKENTLKTNSNFL
jgi:hypothetical protein